jgi:nitroreductase
MTETTPNVPAPDSLLALMRARRSERAFLGKPFPETSLNRILEAATLSPSGLDALPFRLIVVRSPEMKNKIRVESEKHEKDHHETVDENTKEYLMNFDITIEKPFLEQAPILLIVAGDTNSPYWRESTWLAIAYIILAIESEGLGSLTYTPPTTGFLNELLDIPSNFLPEVIIPIGYPESKKSPKNARTAEKIFFK